MSPVRDIRETAVKAARFTGGPVFSSSEPQASGLPVIRLNLRAAVPIAKGYVQLVVAHGNSLSQEIVHDSMARSEDLGTVIAKASVETRAHEAGLTPQLCTGCEEHDYGGQGKTTTHQFGGTVISRN
jgi:hypothetical protein